MNAPAEFANAVAQAVQMNTEDFMPLSVRYGAAEAAWAVVMGFLSKPMPVACDDCLTCRNYGCSCDSEVDHIKDLAPPAPGRQP